MNIHWNWKLFAAVSTLTGTIIGAGFLGIPYMVAKSGLLLGLFWLVLIGLVILIIKLYLGEILLRTRRIHQLPGLAKIYLGKWGYRVMFLSMFVGIYTALVAYLLGEGKSLSVLFFGNESYTLFFAFGFWLVLSFFVYQGIRALKKGESVGIVSVLAILILILISYSTKIRTENLFQYNFNSAFLPVGVIMFAYLGFSALPEILMELRRNENLFKRAIIIGAAFPIVMYVLFTLIVVGVFGKGIPEIATFALGKIFVLLGSITMYTAFFAVSIAMRDIYRFDLYYSKFKAWFLACFVPLVLFLIIYLFRLVTFVQILSIGGVVFGGLNGILILLMVKRARKLGKRKPEYKVRLPSWVIFTLILFLVAGLVLQLVF